MVSGRTAAPCPQATISIRVRTLLQVLSERGTGPPPSKASSVTAWSGEWSGSDQTVALLTADRVLVLPKEMPPKLWEYELGENPTGKVIPESPDEAALKQKLESFLQTATKSLLDNTAGVVDGKPD
jgi:hypothetical protein